MCDMVNGASKVELISEFDTLFCLTAYNPSGFLIPTLQLGGIPTRSFFTLFQYFSTFCGLKSIMTIYVCLIFIDSRRGQLRNGLDMFEVGHCWT